MRAVVQDRFGGPDVLGVRTVDVPTPGADEVLVRVAAAGVDRGTWHLMTGLPFAVRLAGYGFRRPKQPVPGLDLAGTVVAVGSDVSEFSIGDEVYGIGAGTFAEYAVAKATKIAHRPDHVSAEQAATLSVSGATATQALFDVGLAAAGQRVLILGASGGVGSFAVQLAHAHGLHVTGVASAAKADYVTELGADVVLDYLTDDFADEEPFDLIIDIGGRNRISKLRAALTRNGTLVIVGGEGGGRFTGGAGRQVRAMLRSPFVSQRMTTFISDETAAKRAALHELVEQGRIVAPVDRTFPLERAAAALEDLEAGRLRGKAVITIGAGS
ncbi:MAG: NAD(P)-dependent alcohol dehydrogenase [Acidimicrobiaceae bacterium]|nr:NAD(P)-dependent alcohol dehydrogenase [Acidimicrobiaceae bacterium]